MNRLTITRPDDWHLHLRDGRMMEAVLGHTVARFRRAIVMPNLTPPVTNIAQARDYRQRILAALPAGSDFEPLMTLYLTDLTTPDDIAQAHASGFVKAVKLYPAGATTNSEAGVTDIEQTYPALEAMSNRGIPLLVHGEVTDPDVDVFDRERIFIERILAPLCDRFQALKVVFEHVTTSDAIGFVRSARPGVAATITPQHMLLNRNALFQGGLRPHNYCLPVLKAEAHRQAVHEAAVSGNARFFLGTDSAPHSRASKESACGCAGIYSAHAGIELYAEAFDAAGKLHLLEGFASHFGADFYGLERNTDTLTLLRKPWLIPASYAANGEELIPFRAGHQLEWSIQK